MRVTTLNPKGSWTRTYDTDHPVDQLNCEGVRCKTTTTWEGPVLHSKLEGSPLGGFESWRYRRGDTMVVKTSVKKLTSSGGGSGSSGSGGGGKEEVAEGMSSGTSTSCFWFFERMQSLQRHLGGTSRSHLLKALASDHTRVQQATRSDNAYLQKVMLDWNRWSSPADEFIHLPASPSVYSLSGGSGGGGSGRRPPFSPSTSRLRSRASPAGSPMLTSQNPSTNSLVGMSGGGGGGGGASSASQDGILKSSRSPQAPATTRVPGEGEKGPILTSEISLMPQRGSSGENTTNATTNTAAAIAPHTSSSSDITFPVLSNPSSPGTTANTTTTDAGTAAAAAAAAVHPPPPPPPPINPHHSRKYSMESATAAAAATVPRKALHYRSPSTESINLSQVTPCASQAAVGGVGGGGGHPRPPPTGTEALMVYKLREFLESRGITSVVPVTHPHDTTEPQLLGMSPEQAEETAAKLRELETDMLLKRQEQVSGMRCCGLILARENDSLPDHLRVWEMTLA